FGPNLSFRGIDNDRYYRLKPENQILYEDFTGTGNTLNMNNPRVLQLIMDSLRYWITEMHVDGFRFDLASTLARELYAVNALGAFFDIIHQDPVISQVKLIAEPWDLGEGGYQVGNFPVLWTEWNGKYRDSMRKFWRGDSHILSETATRFAGSSDLYESSGKRPSASINFITCHDGFTLQDLVSYETKHNERNLENGHDGWNESIISNFGVEGPTDKKEILEIRERIKRNMIATLLLSQGVPMISGGDELSRTQHGNNNSYCQDNELNYYRWALKEEEEDFLKFVQSLVSFRKSNGVLKRRYFFQGRPIRGTSVKDILWLTSAGREMTDEEWNSGDVKWLGILLPLEEVAETDPYGETIQGTTLLILINSSDREILFSIPSYSENTHWMRIFDTWNPKFDEAEHFIIHEEGYTLRPRSIAVFKNCNPSRDVPLCKTNQS
ncbi:glycogen debranching enzyme, partial [Leptospira perolatii]